MSDTAPYLAKPSGITLPDHTQHVRDQFRKEILPQRQFVVEKYARLRGGDLVERVLTAIQWHDAGKKHDAWQVPCQKDYAEWKAWEEGGRKGKKPVGRHLRKAGIRHEMASLTRLLKNVPDCSTVVQAAIAAHHSKLGYQFIDRWHSDCKGEFVYHWKRFVSLSDELDIWAELKDAVLRRYEYAGVRSYLRLADHRASAEEDGETQPKLVGFTYEFPHATKRGVQHTITELWDEPIALLRAPTGAGKTDAALLWAQHQIQKGRADRLVIAMPTRFTATALAITNTKSLSQTGLYHSSAWHVRERETDENTSLKQRKAIAAEQDLARLLETPVSVTTLDHLCIALTGTREDHHSTFFNLAHSCVVIDEADFYDTFTQANLTVLLEVLSILEVPVLIMSATLPESSCELYGVSRIYEDTSQNERPRCSMHVHTEPITKPSDNKNLLSVALSGKPTIIYANTVLSAQKYYHWFRQQGLTRVDIVLYHSKFTEPDKFNIEERLLTLLGREAQQKKKTHRIAVLTQIGELSINISADYMISELCPADRLVQRIGRLSRFDDTIGDIHLITPYKENKRGNSLPYPAPYGSFHPSQGWIASDALVATQKGIQSSQYSAQQFVDFVNTIYEKMPELDSKSRGNREELEKLIRMNWLMRREAEVEKEDDQTKRWKSRDIDPQVTLLVKRDAFDQFGDSSQSLSSYRDWKRMNLEFGITCQTYEFQYALKNSFIDQCHFVIGADGREKAEEAWVVKPQYYSEEYGLCFHDLNDEEEDDDE